MTGPRDAEAARAAAAKNPFWYHTIQLAPGVTTPGLVDMRRAAERILPDDLSGKRALDIGTFDGFWAFEMERRGADVVAIDVEKIDHAEWPPHKRDDLARDMGAAGVELGLGFKIASEARGSAVRRVVCNFYDLAPEAIGGPVDLAFAGAILLHLRDPVRALERVRETLASPGGELRVLEPFSLALTLRSPRKPAASYQPLSTAFNWWVPNLACIDAWMETARLRRTRHIGMLRPTAKPEIRQTYVARAYGRTESA